MFAILNPDISPIIGSKFVTLLDEEDGDTEKAADKLLEALKN
jgi:tryptophan synthase alpha chain